jgi:hypothetical protein
MTTKTLLFAGIALFFLSWANRMQGQTTTPVTATIEVIQFHNEHRCETCLKIEKQTKATLAKYYAAVPFRLINVEEKKNEKMVNQFEAFGTSLFLYDPKTGRKKDLTDFAFMNANNAAGFEKQLKTHIAEFMKG